jgi:hypothetical protein
MSTTFSYPEQQIEVALVDSHIVETNVYFRGLGEKRLTRSVVGDANCGGTGRCLIRESVITGAGGDYSTVFGNARMLYELSSHRMGFFARDNGVAILDSSIIESHPDNPAANRFQASHSALVAFQNAIFASPGEYPDSNCTGTDLGEYVCETKDDGAIAYATIASPGFGAFVRTSEPVMGAAAVRSSPESPWAFDHYDLWLLDEKGNRQVLTQGNQAQVAAPVSTLCRNETAQLGFLDAAGLTPGVLYSLKLDVFNKAGQVVARTDNAFVYFPDLPSDRASKTPSPTRSRSR